VRALFAVTLILLALILLSLLLWAGLSWAGTTRCTTYEERALNRLHSLCSDGTRAVSTYNRALERWETTITGSHRKICRARMNPSTKQMEVRCR
jgi:hypothetical protein